MAREEARQCRTCGKVFRPLTHHVRRGDGLYCSRSCVPGRGPFEKRWRDSVHFGGPDECWPWIGKVSSGGYAKIFKDCKTRLAHRLALEAKLGHPIPAGMQACHKCDNPRCVNPAHLFLGAAADNVADMIEKGRRYVISGASGANLRVTVEGRRITVTEAARRANVNPNLVYARLRRGWTLERALSEPADRRFAR